MHTFIMWIISEHQQIYIIIKIMAVRPDEDEPEDLVTLFRKKGNFNNKTLEKIGEIQDILKVFLVQEQIYKGEYKPVKKRPLWEEFIDER